MRRTDSYVITGWMCLDLGLSGSELLTYAAIHRVSQFEGHWYHGTIGELAEWTGVSKATALRCLASLVDAGLLLKREQEINGVKFCEYAAVVPDWSEECREQS